MGNVGAARRPRRRRVLGVLLLVAAVGSCDPKAGADCIADCGGHGTCVLAGGQGLCQCRPGYLGADCAICDREYHASGGDCLSDQEMPPDRWRGTPNIDGLVNVDAADWQEVQRAGSNSVGSSWGPNVLADLYVGYDDTTFYVGVRGKSETNNAIVVYLDTDYGLGSVGLAAPGSATDRDDALDRTIASAVQVFDPSFRADVALATRGNRSASSTSDQAGWRALGDGSNFSALAGRVVGSSNGFEASIALSTLFDGLSPTNRQVALFVRLTDPSGSAFANQTLPLDDPAQPAQVNQVAVVTVSPTPQVCNHDGACDAGESTTSCPSDCSPPQGSCGAASAFDWQDTVLYFAMVDRFFDSDRESQPVPGADLPGQYRGGDWRGVQAKLDYVQALGVNALWLSAPYDNRDTAVARVYSPQVTHYFSGYHGYWPAPADISYAVPTLPSPMPAVESRLGTDADLHALIDEAHRRGMRVLFDYVMKHVDITSGLFQAHPDWFVTDSTTHEFVLCEPGLWEDPFWGTRCAFSSHLAPFDFYRADVRAWSVSDAVWWAQSFGIDGFRLDAIKQIPELWLTDARTALAAALPAPSGNRFYLVGETFAYDNQPLIKSSIDPATKLDGQFDFPLRRRLCEAVFAHNLGMSALLRWMQNNGAYYGEEALMATFVGNHDLPRAIHFANGQLTNCYEGSSYDNSWSPDQFPQPGTAAPYERLGVALGILLTSHGVPTLYYGDEIGLAGGGDPDNRRMMQFAGESAPQRALRDLVSALGRARRENIALRRGTRQIIGGTDEVFGYKMTGCGASEDVFVLGNRDDTSRELFGMAAGTYMDLVTGQVAVLGSSVSLGPRSITAYKRMGP